jgi:hypothetical protein
VGNEVWKKENPNKNWKFKNKKKFFLTIFCLDFFWMMDRPAIDSILLSKQYYELRLRNQFEKK